MAAPRSLLPVPKELLSPMWPLRSPAATLDRRLARELCKPVNGRMVRPLALVPEEANKRLWLGHGLAFLRSRYAA
jgi:hypothetical protein